MQELTINQMAELDGEGFWGGVACGLAIVGSVAAAISPDPFSKVALVTYGGTVIGCITAF